MLSSASSMLRVARRGKSAFCGFSPRNREDSNPEKAQLDHLRIEHAADFFAASSFGFWREFLGFASRVNVSLDFIEFSRFPLDFSLSSSSPPQSCAAPATSARLTDKSDSNRRLFPLASHFQSRKTSSTLRRTVEHCCSAGGVRGPTLPRAWHRDEKITPRSRNISPRLTFRLFSRLMRIRQRRWSAESSGVAATRDNRAASTRRVNTAKVYINLSPRRSRSRCRCSHVGSHALSVAFIELQARQLSSSRHAEPERR